MNQLKLRNTTDAKSSQIGYLALSYRQHSDCEDGDASILKYSKKKSRKKRKYNVRRIYYKGVFLAKAIAKAIGEGIGEATASSLYLYLSLYIFFFLIQSESARGEENA